MIFRFEGPICLSPSTSYTSTYGMALAFSAYFIFTHFPFRMPKGQIFSITIKMSRKVFQIYFRNINFWFDYIDLLKKGRWKNRNIARIFIGFCLVDSREFPERFRQTFISNHLEELEPKLRPYPKELYLYLFIVLKSVAK